MAHKNTTSGAQVAESMLKAARGKIFQYLESWDWTYRGGATFSTPEGDVNLDVDASCTIQRCLVRAWTRDLMATDNRCKGDDTEQLLRSGSFPFFEAHKLFAARGGSSMKAAIGAAPDCRNSVGLVTSRLKKWDADKLPPHPETRCTCGFAEPTRRHFLWHCPHVIQPPLLRFAPRCGMEEGLMVPLVVQPKAPLPRTLTRERAFQYKVELLLRGSRAGADGLVRVATDGGSEFHGFNSCGGVGIAVSPDRGESTELFGLSQAPGFAELMAALYVLRAASVVGCDVLLIIDNWNVVRALRNAAKYGTTRMERFSYGLWWEAARLMDGRAHIFQWIPSHGKQLSWRPPAPYEAELDSWRRMNGKADVLATRGVRTLRRRRVVSEASIAESDEAASSWALACLQLLRDTCDRYYQPFLDWVSIGNKEEPAPSGAPAGLASPSAHPSAASAACPVPTSLPLSVTSTSTTRCTMSVSVQPARARPRATGTAPEVPCTQAKRRKVSVGC